MLLSENGVENKLTLTEDQIRQPKTSMVNTWEDRLQRLPDDLKKLLSTDRDSLPKAIQYLEENTTEEQFESTESDWSQHWETTGLFYINNGMPHQAIGLFEQFYQKLCTGEKRINKWFHKAVPLVWIRDCRWMLGHHALAQRFMLLTLIEDSIRENGQITVNKSGVYHRFCWEHGFSDASFIDLSRKAYEEYQKCPKLGIFPEWILGKLQGQFLPAYPSSDEADLYIINPVYSHLLLKSIMEPSGTKIDGTKLEHFASYMLGSIPGFEVELRKQTRDYHFDGFIRNRGLMLDFRADLGNYILVECKDWTRPASVDTISHFAFKLQMHDCRAGILFSKNGITGISGAGEGDPRYAALTLLKSYHHAGRIIMILDENDFKEAAEGKNLIQILQGKYEQVRFDLT